MRKFWISVLQIFAFLFCSIVFERFALRANDIMFFFVLPFAYVPALYFIELLICKTMNFQLCKVPFIIMTVYIGFDVLIHVLSNLYQFSSEQPIVSLSKIWFYGTLAIAIPLLYRLIKYGNES